jgi:hypothetical protein
MSKGDRGDILPQLSNRRYKMQVQLEEIQAQIQECKDAINALSYKTGITIDEYTYQDFVNIARTLIQDKWGLGQRKPGAEAPELVNVKLSCTYFGTLNGRSDQWITFKENTLSKAGVEGYAQYFRPDFIQSDSTEDGNQCLFYLLKNATNGGGASHIIWEHAQTADGHAAWQALLAWYEGPVMLGKISKTLCSKLSTLRLQAKGRCK